jgi:hypothetical protein
VRSTLLILLAGASAVIGVADDRTFRFTHLQTDQEFNEAATLMAGLLRPAEVTSAGQTQSTVTVRGEASDLALAAWIAEKLDSGMPDGGVQQTPAGGQSSDVVELLSLGFAGGMRSFQEAATVVRSIGEIRTLFTSSHGHILALRGSPAQAELAQWLVAEFAKASSGTASPTTRQFADLASPDDTVAVLYLKSSPDQASFQRAAVQIRSATGIRRFFTYTDPKAFVIRSTAEQVARAGQMVDARN